jgi:hypothetical protein
VSEAKPIPAADVNGQLIVSAMIVLALMLIAVALAGAVVFIDYDADNIKDTEAIVNPMVLAIGTIVGIFGNALAAPSGISNVLRAVPGARRPDHPEPEVKP